MNYDFLKQYLKDHKITRSQFAESIDVSIYDVNNWFSRKPKKFPVEMAVKIASTYHIMLDDLIGGEAASNWFFDSIIGTKIETEQEARVIQILDSLNDQGAEKFIESGELIQQIPKYRKDNGENHP